MLTAQPSPSRIRFRTFTTRYNQSCWLTVDALEKHYERAEVDAKRSEGRKQYEITTTNVARLILRETEHAANLMIDGQNLRVSPAAEIALINADGSWMPAQARVRPVLKSTACKVRSTR